MDVYEKYSAPVIALARVPKSEVSAYGVAAVEPVEGNVFRITKFVEKPKPEEAPYNISSLPLYVFSPAILDLLAYVQPSARGGTIDAPRRKARH